MVILDNVEMLSRINMAGITDFVGILFLIAGFVLIGVELCLPGFGIPGTSGIICLGIGIVACADSLQQGLSITIVVIVLLAIMLTIGLTVLKNVKSPFVLDDKLKMEDSYLNDQDLDYLIGKIGVASTDLRPGGKCKIDDVEFDVRTEGSYIDKGTPVKIYRIHNKSIIVNEI